MFILLILLQALFLPSAAYSGDPSANIPISEIHGSPSSMVAGCVNILTGAYTISNVDLVVPGAEPLVFQSLYSSYDFMHQNLSDGWEHQYVGQLACMLFEGPFYGIKVPESYGSFVNYKSNKLVQWEEEKMCGIRVQTFAYSTDSANFTSAASVLDDGLTNISTGEISGNTHSKNQTIAMVPGDKHLEVTLSNGGKRFFELLNDGKYLPFFFQIRKETTPTGLQITYGHYAHKVTKLDFHQRNRHYGSLDISLLENGKRILTASDGQQATYHIAIDHEKKRNYITRICRPNGIEESFDYTSPGEYSQNQQKIIKRTLPDGRYQQIEYYGLSEAKKPEKDANTLGSVKCLLAPVGVDQTPIVTHRFFYKFNYDKKNRQNYLDGSYAEVHDAYGRKTRFHLLKGRRLQAIERLKNNIPYSTERFYWGTRPNNQQCNLICQTLEEGHHKTKTIHSCHYFEYDGQHNPIREHSLGSFTGLPCSPIAVSTTGVPKGGEWYTIQREFTQDEFHLKTQERFPNGKTIHYRYKEGTNLLTEVTMYDHDKLVSKQTTDYDFFNVPCKVIVEDGSQIKRITTIISRQTTPALGLPQQIQESYIDPITGYEHSLGHKNLHYNAQGRLIRQDIYDADGLFRCSLHWGYDRMGNVIWEQDALGNVTTRSFDANGNKILEKGPSTSYYHTYAYDFSNRLINKTRWNTNGGEALTETYSYDYCSNLICATDIHGQKTSYTYDDFNRLIKTTLPNGQVITQDYNVTGDVICTIDADGNATHTTYNSRKQPIKITYSDGSSEAFEYDINGNLRCKIAKNDTKTWYEHDVLGNVVKTTVEGHHSTFSVYDGSLLIAQTDPNGNTTSYQYDGAGRRTRIIKPDGTQTSYEYDSLGKLRKETTENRETIRQYDLMGNLIEEEVSGLLRTTYTYNEEGKCTATITYDARETPCPQVTEYDWTGQVSRTIDPLGNETLLHYSYKPTLTITSVDPLGNQTITYHDVMGKPTQIVRKDIMGIVTAETYLQHDNNGRLTQRTDLVILNNTREREMITLRKYDSLGRVTELVEASQTPLARHTYYSYYLSGEKQSEIYSDGTQLLYEYDTLGRLQRYYASDNSIDYVYHYDLNGNILAVDDNINQTSTTRCYDACNRVTEEVLANGLVIRYVHDGNDRITTILLPDSSSIDYVYDGAFMRSVRRSGQHDYEHTYDSFDLSGHLLEATLIGSAGKITREWDLAGRPISLSSYGFSETDIHYDNAGNLCSATYHDGYGTTPRYYQYNALYQLSAEDGVVSHTYDYDSINNRRFKDSTECEVDALNRLISCGEILFGYDARGNRTSRTTPTSTTTYLYDALGRLTKVIADDMCYEYLYDSFNRRLVKTCQEEKIFYLYQDQLEIGSATEQGNLCELRVLGKGLGAEIGAAIAIEIGQELFVPYHDHNGNVAALTSASGKSHELYRYSAFGEELIYQKIFWKWWKQVETTQNPWRFSSKRVDPETHLIAFGRRFYDPEMGRWITPDPKGYDDGPNLYAYVHNRPLTLFDLFGLQARSKAPPPRERRRPAHHAYTPQEIGGGLNRIRSSLFQHVSGMGHHLLPCEFLQHPWMNTCCMLGGFDKDLNYMAPSQVLEFGRTNPLNSTVVTAINGICTSLPEMKERALKFQEACDGCSIIAVYTQNKGLVRDVAECAANILNFRTHSQDVAEQGIVRALELAKAQDGPLIIAPFSRGGLTSAPAIDRFNDKELSMMYTVSSGSARFINDNRLGSCMNLVHCSDSVPLVAGFIPYFKAYLTNDPSFKMIGSYTDAIPFTAHSFDTYYFDAMMNEVHSALDSHNRRGNRW